MIIVYDPYMPQIQADSLVDRLFIQASSGEVMFRNMVQPSKDSIAALGAKALPRMCAKLTTRDARERWAISDILRALGTVATDSLISYLGNDNQYVLLNVGRCLEQIKDTAATVGCLPLLRHEKYPVRSQFAAALGQISDPRAVPDLVLTLAGDPVDDVRKSSAVALGLIGDARATEMLIVHLNDQYFGVRKAASEALLKLDPVPLDEIALAAGSHSGIAVGMVIETLGKTKDERAEEYLLPFLESPAPLIRGYTIDALGELGTEGARRALRRLDENTKPRSLFEQARLRAALARADQGDKP
jgi:HEAT repeat protein